MADELDTAAPAAAETNTKSSSSVPCKCNCECDEDDEESYTIIRHKELTITIYGKILIRKDLVSLSKYEVSVAIDK